MKIPFYSFSQICNYGKRPHREYAIKPTLEKHEEMTDTVCPYLLPQEFYTFHLKGFFY